MNTVAEIVQVRTKRKYNGKAVEAKIDRTGEEPMQLRFNPRFPKANFSIAGEFETILDRNRYDEVKTCVDFFLGNEDHSMRVVHDSFCMGYLAVYPNRGLDRLYTTISRAMLFYSRSQP